MRIITEPITQAPATDNPDKKQDPSQSEGNGQESKKLYAGKYETVEALEEGYKNTSGQASTMAEKVKEYEKALEEYDPIIRAVWSDPELVKQVQDKLSGKKTETKTQPNNSGSDLVDSASNAQLRVVMKQMETMTLENFFEKKKIDKLPEEEQEQVKKGIGQYLKDIVDPSHIDIQKLPKQLDAAYTLYKASLGESDRKDDDGEDYANELGKTGQSPSSSSQSTRTTPLTAEEKKVAQRMGLSEKDYAEYKSKSNS